LTSLTEPGLEVPSCPLCGATERRVRFSGRTDLLHRPPGSFGIARCSDCPVDYLCPRPDATGRELAYPDSYGPWTTEPVESNLGPWSYRLVKAVAERL
jgi:hypothetical protein